jgi:hypothetical protein
VKGVIRSQAENKFLDDSVTDTSLVDTDSNSLQNGIALQVPQGDGESSRDGNKLIAKGMTMRILLTTTVSASVRFLMIKVPVFDAGLDFNTPFAAVGVNGQLPRNTEGKYKVLWDKTLNVDPDSKGSIALKRYQRLDSKMEYISASTAAPIRNNILLYAFTNNSTASAISVALDTRLHYMDI